MAKMLRHSEEKQPSLLQIAASHRSVRYNTDLPPPSHSICSSKFWAWSCIAVNFDKGWREITSTIMNRPCKPKYGTVSQVLLQLIVGFNWLHQHSYHHVLAELKCEQQYVSYRKTTNNLLLILDFIVSPYRWKKFSHLLSAVARWQ